MTGLLRHSNRLQLVVFIAVIAALASLFAIGSVTASAVDRGHADPATLTAADFCDDPLDTDWYQVAHWSYDPGFHNDFNGSVIACSGWDAARVIALSLDYDSIYDALHDNWYAGNRGEQWVPLLPSVDTYSP